MRFFAENWLGVCVQASLWQSEQTTREARKENTSHGQELF